MSRDDYFAARYICEPLRRPDYCLINDGGVALIVAAADLARDLAQPPAYVRGYGQASALSAVGLPAEDFWHAPLAAAGRDSYVMAGVAREDVSALMIYDNFTPTVIFSLEGLGFCPVGEGGPYVAEGHLRLGGRHPANTSGGHLSESYMQGWALNVEAVRQLRGACGPRQVPDARLVQYVCASPLVTSILYGSDPQ
jgi:acetyl-CoA acetyltransferase